MTDTWYSPCEIMFNRDEMIFLIAWLPYLEGGNWPPEHKDTGYNGARRSGTPKSPFERAVGFSAEVNHRLRTTKEAGEALVDEIQGGITEYELLSRPAKRALNYISGWRRREQTYAAFRADTNRREKNHKLMVSK